MAQVTAAVEARPGKPGLKTSPWISFTVSPARVRSSGRKTFSAAVSLAPEHLSCYGLKVEPGTPLYARQAEEGFARR